MKKILTMIAIAISTTTFAQQHIITYWDIFHKTKQEDYYLNTRGEEHGKYVAYFSDGSINAERTYKDGLLDGKEILYYNDETGRGLAHIYNYKNNKKEGLQQSYIESEYGSYYFKYVRTEEFYKNGERVWRKTYEVDNKNKRCLRKEELYKYNGYAWALYITKGYAQNGHQFYQVATDGRNFQDGDATTNKLEFYTKKSKKDGLYREWYSNGQIADSAYYRDDVEYIDVQWDRNGKVIKEYNSQVEPKKTKIQEEDGNGSITEMPVADALVVIDTPKKEEKLRSGGATEDVKKLKQLQGKR